MPIHLMMAVVYWSPPEEPRPLLLGSCASTVSPIWEVISDKISIHSYSREGRCLEKWRGVALDALWRGVAFGMEKKHLIKWRGLASGVDGLL